ncbi:MAG: CHAT domain-containing protein [Deltaproteobacteria bacterium]|nr:CHAT domain-containing protein [Deltaproteobacteria bacterium]
MTDRIKLRLPGSAREISGSDSGLGDFANILGAQVMDSTDVRMARSRGVEEEHELYCSPNDVFELTWEDGIVELVRAEDIVSNCEVAQRSPGDDGWFAIPTRRTISGYRGGQEIALEAVKRIGLKAAEAAMDFAFPKIIRNIEEKHIPNPGLYRLNAKGELTDRQDGKIKTDNPILVLIHGTFSSTRGGFANLFESRDWDRMINAYKIENMFALEQHTVTCSPALNAIHLAEAIQSGAKVHLLSHSRGGLVGDLLCRYPWENRHVDAYFKGEQYAHIREELALLANVRGDFEVERFARVAAPAAGTLLASDRLDKYLNVILSVAGKLMGPNALWFEFIKAIAMAIVATRTRADALPGIQAMMPPLEGSENAHGFIPFLNVATPRGKDLAVIAGDVEGGGFFDRVKSFFSDLYYHEDNDFVVDSKSMFRGVPRKKARGFYYRAPRANHFSYFKEPETRSRIVDWLVDGNETGFRPLSAAEPYGGLRGTAPVRSIKPVLYRENLPTVFLIPGIMGSHLAVDGERHWISIFELAWKGMAPLQIDKPDVAAEALVDMAYEKLFHRLTPHYNVRPFPYDWRKPMMESARLLAIEIEAELKRHNRPIRLIAHSMGGLVARTLIMDRPELWKQLTERGGRLLMMGTPNQGSFVPAQVLTKKHALMKQLAVVAIRHNLDELTGVVREFPGMIELLPFKGDTNLLDATRWAPITNCLPKGDTLEKAQLFRAKLDRSAVDMEHMVYVAGHAADTPAEMVVSKNGEVHFRYSSHGDGTVLWDFGRLDGVCTYYVAAEHGQIANHEESFDGYMELLSQGTTARLSKKMPVAFRGEHEELREIRIENEDAHPRYFPSTDDVISTLMGKPPTSPLATTQPISLVVFNGDVRECTFPVLVGHYEGDPLVSVEATLNQGLDGAMARDHRLDRYVGRLGTVRIYEKKRELQGVVVSGLGQVGTLTRTSLEESLRHAMMEYALANLPQTGDDPCELGVSGVLIGTFGATRLSVEDSLRAYVEAAQYTNARLRAEGLGARVCLSTIEISELFQDKAIEATRAALRISKSSEYPVTALPKLQHRSGALKFRPRTPYGSGWHRRIRINKDAHNNLEYELTTEMARVEPTVREIQWAHVDGLLERAMQADRDVARTLFNYLLPYDMLEGAEASPDLVLQLHPQTAQIPWELLDPGRDGQRPIGVRVGILRNYVSVESRANPRRSASRRALVIGEPAMVNPPLPSAKAEAEKVANLLHLRGLDVNRVIGRDADDCFESLYQGEYDIVHVAAHGAFDGLDAKKTGVVLAGNRFLGAAEFENMTAVPSIVFLNCCHLGKFSHLKYPGHLAASVSKRLIEMGVKVVVVAGWAVGDKAAGEFAENFYSAMLKGENLMRAVRGARQKTYSQCTGNDVTWGAYQVYGYPGFVLPYDGLESGSEDREQRFVAVDELVDYVSDFVSRSRDPKPEQKAYILNELKRLTETELETDSVEWRENGELLTVIADAYSELGALEKAIKWYKQALTLSNTPLKAVEQLANLEAKQAAELYRKLENKSERKEVDALFKRSLDRIRELCHIRPSSERYCLEGATLRRMADCRDDTEKRSKFLAEALKAYTKAAKLKPSNLYYPLDNKIQLQLLLGKEIDPLELNQIEQSAAGAHDKWAPGSAANAALVRYAVTGRGSAQTALEAYTLALTGGSGVTQREKDSLLQSLKRLEGVADSKIKERLKEVTTVVAKWT